MTFCLPGRTLDNDSLLKGSDINQILEKYGDVKFELWQIVLSVLEHLRYAN